MSDERLETYVDLARTVVPLLTTMRHPSDPSDKELLAAIRDNPWPPPADLEGALRRYAIRETPKTGPGRPSQHYRDTAIVYFVKAFRRCGMTKKEAIATILEVLPYGLSADAIQSILRKG